MSATEIINIAFKYLVPGEASCLNMGFMTYYWRGLLKNNGIADNNGYIFSRPCLELKQLAHQELIHLINSALEYACNRQIALARISLRCPQIMDRLTWANYIRSGGRDKCCFKALTNWFESQEKNYRLVIYTISKMTSQIKISFVKKDKLKRHLVVL